MRFVATAILTAALAAIFALPAVAQDGAIGFRSPSNNIHCQFFAGDTGKDDDASIRCDLMQTNNRPLSRPRDCDMEFGDAFEITGGAARGEPLCHGDTVKDDTLPILSYGQNWQRQGLTCRSEQSGVSCINPKGHGFELSRGAQRVF
ncbi:MAG: DUF6636 domain-containing protein [Xanthobacteraceae bacterium]